MMANYIPYMVSLLTQNKDVWVDKKQLMELFNEIRKIKVEE